MRSRGGNHHGQSKPRWRQSEALAFRRASPTCAAPTGAASRAASAATPVFPGWTHGMPCGACLRRASSMLFPLRASFGRLGVGLPACGARPPALRGLPAGGQAGDLRPPLPPAFATLPPPSLSSFGRPHLRSALTATPSRPLRCASCPCRGGVRLATLPARSYRCVSVSPRPRLGGACKAGGRAPSALADRASPPTTTTRMGSLCLTTAASRLPANRRWLPPSIGDPSGAPHEATARRSLRSLRLAPPSTWLSLPSVARP